MTYKKSGWIAGCLVTLGAGIFGYSYLTSYRQPSSETYFSPSAPAKTEPRSNYYEKPKNRTLNSVITSMRMRNSQENNSSSAVPIDKYSIEETFAVDEDTDIGELGELFHNDCAGVCIYMKDSNSRITKVKLSSNPAEPITWYDENNDCFKLTGNNFWFYTDDSGVMKAWGIGNESKTSPERVYSPCE